MTNKELIGILQALPPDSIPCFSLGKSGDAGKEYRRLCAKAELKGGGYLDFLHIDSIEIINKPWGGPGIWADIYLAQDSSLSELESFGKKFDEQYKKVK